MSATASALPFPARRLLRAGTWLTTPLLPDDYLSLVNPLWSTRELRGRVEAVQPETADAATLVLRPGGAGPATGPASTWGSGSTIDGVRHWRTYSLTSPPRDRTAASRSRSRQSRTAGCPSIWCIAPPRRAAVLFAPAQGEFVLPSPAPPRLLFVTAGSGITP